MSDNSRELFEQMLNESMKTIRRGEIIEGTVIDVTDNEVIVNIGYKCDGTIPKSEFTSSPDVELKSKIKVGDVIKAKVTKVNDSEGQVLLTYKRLLSEDSLRQLEEAFKNKDILTGKVSLVLDGGLVVIVNEVRVFIPASLVSDEYVSDLKVFQGQTISFQITEFNAKKNRIIGNRKRLVLEDKKKNAEEKFTVIKEGDFVEGVVKNVTDYGAFVNIDGLDGLLHISELSYGRVDKVTDVIKVGQKVKALVIGKNEKDYRISLSLKFPENNPWNLATSKYAVGTVVTGRVARMTDFGAFIELEDGVDALLHVSQISIKHVEKPSDTLKISDIITAKVTDFNGDAKKISLSIKALEVETVKAEKETVEVIEE